MNGQLLSWLLFLAGAIFVLLWLAYTIKQKILSGAQVREFLFSSDGKRLYGGGPSHASKEYRGWVGAWETATGRLLWQYEVLMPVATLALSPDGTSLLTAGAQGYVSRDGWGEALLWEAETGAPRFPLRDERHDRTTDNVYFAPDGLRLFGCFQEGIQLWDAQTGKPLAFWELPADKAGWPTSLHFSPDGNRLVVQASSWSDEEGEIEHGSYFVQLWDAHAGELVQDFLMDKTTRCAFSTDSKKIALIRYSQPCQIELWTVEGERKNQSPELPAGFKVYRLAFQPDGNVFCDGLYDSSMKTIISTSSSSWQVGPVPRKQAFLWDTETNQLTERPFPEEETLSPDGTLKAVVNIGPVLGTLYRTNTDEKLCDLEGLAGR
ncbi:MAG: hypothetical protein QM758_07100 [Armatimonas sp.]